MRTIIALLLQPFGLAMLLAWLALADLWRRGRRTEPRLRPVAASLALGLLSLSCLPAVSYLVRAPLEWRSSPLRGVPPSAQAIVVLGGYYFPADTIRPVPQLGDDSRERCAEAARLARLAPELPLLLSGGELSDGNPGITVAGLMRRELELMGIAPARLQLEERSRSTATNASACRPHLAANGWTTIILVTDALHMPRAAGSFRRQSLTVIPAPCRQRTTRFEWSWTSFWPNPHAAAGLAEAVHEWLGLAWYRLRGRV